MGKRLAPPWPRQFLGAGASPVLLEPGGMCFGGMESQHAMLGPPLALTVGVGTARGYPHISQGPFHIPLPME